ncbi:hypothetical protein P9112_002854 [Eukaryota sp. TZLM1-RC]
MTSQPTVSQFPEKQKPGESTARIEHPFAPLEEVSKPSLKKAMFSVPLAGIICGFILLKTQLYLPQVIRDQFSIISDPKHADYTLLVFGLSAIAASSVVFSVISMIAPNVFKSLRNPLYNTNQGRIASFAGSLLVGSGMAMNGHTPLVLMTQLCTNCTNYNPFLGMLTGASVAMLVKPYLRMFLSLRASKQKAKPYMDTQLNMNTAFFLSLQALVFTALAIAASHFLLKWTIYSGWVTFSMNSMIHHPLLSGQIYGLINFLLVPSVMSGISAYKPFALLAQSAVAMFPKLGMVQPPRNLENYWQFLFLAFTFGSSFLGKRFTPVAESCEIADPRRDFVGSFLQMFGAQLASGDPSYIMNHVAMGSNYESLLGMGIGGVLTNTFVM